MIVGPLFSVLFLTANTVLAFACGPEVLLYSGMRRVFAEPVPNGVTAEVSMLDLTYKERSTMSMVHSLHDLDTARGRVASWIMETEHTGGAF
jgi:hypothetical protein